MKSLVQSAFILGLVLLLAAPISAKRCLVQEDSGFRAGRISGGGSPGERAWVARYPLPATGSVSVENVQGNILVEGWARAEVEVVISKRALGGTASPDDVHIDVANDGRNLTLRTIYPSQSGDAVRVDYRLRVPRQIRLEHLRTVEGSIRVRDIEGSVDARTLNGSIENLNVTGQVSARAINGNIAVSLRALPEGSAPVQMETVNGHLFLTLPSEASADLQLRTVAGRVESGYTLTVSETPGDASMRTRLGRGGNQIRLRTVRGNIYVTENDELL